MSEAKKAVHQAAIHLLSSHSRLYARFLATDTTKGTRTHAPPLRKESHKHQPPPFTRSGKRKDDRRVESIFS
ncbi:hypothetical protein E2C01_061786 [Portunus trituberculatus]|uniref:Uncharacterized protein n=1 Tax=Portunus trituberculatus TaxID=210409 RepID=A0A5B7HCT7_PORTR|nr:hypothetical protein [Portunus trituberculatus]